MKIRFLKDWRLHKAGSVSDMDEEIAAPLFGRGLIELDAGVSAIETAMVEPQAERAVRPRGRPRKVEVQANADNA